jgi:hypothetical protein
MIYHISVSNVSFCNPGAKSFIDCYHPGIIITNPGEFELFKPGFLFKDFI